MIIITGARASFIEGNVNKVERPVCEVSQNSEVTMTEKTQTALEIEALFVVLSTIR